MKLSAGGQFFRTLGVYSGRINAEADIGIVWKWSVVERLMTELDLQVTRELQHLKLSFGDESVEFVAALKKYSLREIAAPLPEESEIRGPERGIPEGFISHNGTVRPVSEDTYVSCVIRTDEGLGFSRTGRAKYHEWEWNGEGVLGAIVAYKVVASGTSADVYARWPEEDT